MHANWTGTRRRHLSPSERACAFEIFENSIDCDVVVITRGSFLSAVTATAIGNRVYLQAEHFIGETLNLSETGRLVLVHELAHVWQFQNGGFAYIPSSLFAQIWGLLRTGSRRSAYDWRRADRHNCPWNSWNAEQQAECIADYNEAARRTRWRTAAAEHEQTLSIALPYIREMRCGAGAPAWRTYAWLGAKRQVSR